MNWQLVIDSLRAQAEDAIKHAEALRTRMPTMLASDPMIVERGKTIERHRINGNFCLALAEALEAGIES